MTLVATPTTDGPNVHPSAVETATGQTPALDFKDALEAYILLDVTAVSGSTPTLDVMVEESVDKNTWTTHTTFAQRTAPGTELKKLTSFARYLRADFTIGGTSPSFTFAMKTNAKG